jgi:hypothetical protein
VDAITRGDPYLVFLAAIEFNRGDYSALEIGNYLFRYPHQMGLVTFDRLIAFFSQNLRFYFGINLILVILSNLLALKICGLWFEKNETIKKYTIILTFMFLPQFFFILFPYGLIPGMVGLLSGVYYLTKYHKNGGIKNAILSIIAFAIAILIRNNYAIGLVAVVIVCFLIMIKNKKWSRVILISILIASAVLPGKIISQYYRSVSGTEFGNGTPMILWAAMGLQESSIANGWYNGFNYNTFEEVRFNSDAASEIAKIEIAGRIEYFINHPKYTVDFFISKIKSTWCDPTFQSIWSGPLLDWNQKTYTALLQNLYSAGEVYNVYASFINVIVAIILFYSLVYLVVYRKYPDNDYTVFRLFPVLFLIGGFMFHLVWETKSQYVYMYIWLLIPLAASSIVYVEEKFSKFLSELNTK